MAHLILDEIDARGDSDRTRAALKREAEILRESFSPTVQKGKGEMTVSMMERPSLVDRVMHRFIWWFLGCPIGSKN